MSFSAYVIIELKMGETLDNETMTIIPVSKMRIALIVLLTVMTIVGIEAQEWHLPANTIQDADWSPDGSKLAIASVEGLRVIDVVTNTELPGFQPQSPPIYVVEWSPDGLWLATTGANFEISIWDISDGALIATLDGHDVRIADLAWSPDGTQLLSGTAAYEETYELRTWDMTTYAPLAKLSTGPVAEVLWLPNSAEVLAATTTGGLLKLDANLTIEGISQIPYAFGPAGPVGSIALHPDGIHLAISSFYESQITIWDMVTEELLTVLEDDTFTGFAIALDWQPGTDVLASVGRDGIFRTWDTLSGEVIDAIEVGPLLTTVAWHPDGEQIVYGGESPDGEIEILTILQLPIAMGSPIRLP